MSRAQWIVAIAFLVLVAGLGALLAPGLLDSPRRVTPWEPGTGVPLDASHPGAAPVPAAAPSDAGALPRPTAVPPTPTAPVAPPAPTPARPRRDLAVRVRVAAGTAPAPAPAALAWVGARPRGEPRADLVLGVERTARDAWVGAPGFLWAPLPPVVSTDPVEVVLQPAGAKVAVAVVEADGKPAVDVPVAWAGPSGRPLDHRTDAQGLVTVSDRAPGVLRIQIGSRERAGPVRVVRVGAGPGVQATLDPSFVVEGRAFEGAGPSERPFANGLVRAWTPEGDAGAVRTKADGTFRWVGRMSDRLAFRGDPEDGRIWDAVEVPMPDPKGALRSRIELRSEAAPVGAVTLDLRRLGPGGFARVVAEPAVLALVRENYGPDEVGPLALTQDGPDVPLRTGALPADLPWRVSVRGDVVPEDHLLPRGDGRRAGLAIAPFPLPPEPAGPETDPCAAYVGRIHGRVTDRDGKGLLGVTVAAGGRRVVSGADGAYELTKLPMGERLPIVFAWLDGADTGGVDPSPFVPWFEAAASASPDAVDLVLPKAASVTFRVVDGLDGKPLSWARVVLLDGSDAPRFDDVVATVDGRVTLTGLVPGTPGTLAVFAPGLRREVPLALRGGDTVDAGEVSLVHGGRVDGVVKSATGAPVVGASVVAMEDGRGEGGGKALVRERDFLLRRTVTDAQGAFVLDGLDLARPAALAIYASGYAPSARRVVWGADGKGRLAATLSRGGTARLRLSDPSGAPVTGALVDLRDARTGARRLDLVRRAGWGSWIGSSRDVRVANEALTIEDPASPGSYRLGPVEPGPYDVFVDHPAYKPVKTQTTIVDASPGSADNPMRIPLEGLEWRLPLEPLPAPVSPGKPPGTPEKPPGTPAR